MHRQLFATFDVTLYDRGLNKHPVRFDGVSRDSDRSGGPWVFSSWLKIPDDLPNVNSGLLLIELQHRAGTYPTRNENEAQQVGGELAILFVAFLQGAVLGWNVVEHDLVEAGERRDEISIERKLHERTIAQALQVMKLDERRVRRFCREDVRRYAVEYYEQHGAMAMWTTQQFIENGISRLPYPQELINGVCGDFCAEGRLETTFQVDRFWIKPSDYDARSAGLDGHVENWLSHIDAAGRELGCATETPESKEGRITVSDDLESVFVVHGRKDRVRRAMFEFLRSIGLKPLEWSQAVQRTGAASPYVGQVLETAFAGARAVVVVLSGDDEARLIEVYRKADDPAHECNLTPQARPNVLFEAGMAMGRNAERTILVQVGDIRPFSDIGGRHVVRMDNSTQRRQDLANRLETAGCAVDLTGTDWHDAGNFEC